MVAARLRRHCCCITLSLSALIHCGCSAFIDRMQKPPGPVQHQRFQATLHDPYPSPHGMPVTAGTRPRDYLDPLPQPVQDRYLRDLYWAGRQPDEPDEE